MLLIYFIYLLFYLQFYNQFFISFTFFQKPIFFLNRLAPRLVFNLANLFLYLSSKVIPCIPSFPHLLKVSYWWNSFSKIALCAWLFSWWLCWTFAFFGLLPLPFFLHAPWVFFGIRCCNAFTFHLWLFLVHCGKILCWF